ncbi:hypothetical protein ABBQ32_005771 [Trebouxia sp. C0010 RCD-2024]
MTKSEPSKVTGNLKSAQGAVKETLGAAVGAKQMESEGKATRAEGNTEVEAAKAKGYAEGAGDSLAGGVKKNIAKVTGNDQKEAEGKARQTKGDAKKAANK